MDEFTITEKKADDLIILYLNGFLDAHTSSLLEKKFEELLSKKLYKVIVNFSGLSYISSAGLGVFMAYIETMRSHDGDIKLSDMSDKIFNIFDMLGFPILFNILKDENEAVNKFNETV
ncbi:MAG: STAS domain-containing protein [Ignavibacteria bacterium]|jgi:anti-sigma B factor antagonist|nr:STAS domain-containing protein [Ignavibacteria bacterium]